MNSHTGMFIQNQTKAEKPPPRTPPNIIAKMEELDSLKEQVTANKIKSKEEEAAVTEQIIKLERKLAATKRQKKKATKQIDKWKNWCIQLEKEVKEKEKELKEKEKAMNSLSNAQAVLTTTIRDLGAANSCLLKLLSDKQKIDIERDRIRRDLNEAKSELQRCEDGLQELERKERATEQEWQRLKLRQDQCRQIVEYLENRKKEIEKEYQKYQKELIEASVGSVPVPEPAHQVPPNIIAKMEELDSLKEQVTANKIKSKKEQAAVTEQIKELERELAATKREREEATEQKDEHKNWCNELERALQFEKGELEDTNEMRNFLQHPQSDTTSNANLEDPKSIKRKIGRTEKTLEKARSELQGSEEVLQELQVKERANAQKMEDLKCESERYQKKIRELKRKEKEIKEEYKKCQRDKKMYGRVDTPAEPMPGRLPPITTVAQQPESYGEQEVGQYSDDDEPVMDPLRVDVNTETKEDKVDTNPLPEENLYLHEKGKYREINTQHTTAISMRVKLEKMEMNMASEG